MICTLSNEKDSIVNESAFCTANSRKSSCVERELLARRYRHIQFSCIARIDGI